MKHFIFPLLLLCLFSACDDSAPYMLPADAKVLYCETADFAGYIVPDSQDPSHPLATGRLYIDNGKLFSDPVNIEVAKSKGSGALIIKGIDLEAKVKELESYVAPSQPEPTWVGINYRDSIFDYQVTYDVPYAKAPGYWTSYPDDLFAGPLDIYKGKFEYILTDSYEDRELLLDVYTPQDSGLMINYPLVIMIHGGAFYNGDKQDEEYTLWCKRLAGCGYLAVSINYRLGWGPSTNAFERCVYRSVQDVRASIRYMLSHSSQYRIDPNRVYLAGCSAGAIAAVQATFMMPSDRPASTYASKTSSDLGELDDIAAYEQTVDSFHIDAICNMWGGIFDKLGCRILHNQHTKILSIQSENDHVVPAHLGYPYRNYTDILRKVGDLSLLLTSEDYTKGVIPEIIGSYDLDQYLTDNQAQLGIEHKLIGMSREVHTLVRDDDKKINYCHREFFDEMCCFFSDDMLRHPISLQRDPKNSQHIFNQDPTDVVRSIWKVEGGIVKSISHDGSQIQVLLFSDVPAQAITYEGIYASQLPFSETINF